MNEYFGGEVRESAEESTPWWPPGPPIAADSPNVVIILLDDTGFAHLGCYGSSIETPNIDKLAVQGVRFSNFHATALCSPTRAALLTGRNHHAVGMRAVSNFDTGFSNMRGAVSRHAATLAEILRKSGYGTLAVGKWHLAPTDHCSTAGPFEHWPLQRGFDRYYGYLPGTTDHFDPELTYDNHHIDPPLAWGGEYHLTEDLADRSMEFVRDFKSVYPDRPFFLYWGLGATHNPHQAPDAYLQKYRGRFDAGWDVAREDWFERQRSMGIVPQGTQLAPRNDGVRPWADLSEPEQRIAARLQEAFAAFLDHTDAQIGRVVQFLEELGELDNTLLLLMSDNGASQEGGASGQLDERHFTGDAPLDIDAALTRLDDIGTRRSMTNIPWGWAQAGNTPLKWYKQNTHGGGVRVPFIAHWPDGRLEPGAIRDQFHHVSDVAPTVMEVLGITAPDSVQGYDQMPVTGTSFAYALRQTDAPTRKPVQYFEMFGHRGIWSDGWKAVTRHIKGTPYAHDSWELYHLDEDFSESHNLEREHPEKLAELIDLWWREARSQNVLPLDDRVYELFQIPRPASSLHSKGVYRYLGKIAHLPTDASPPLGTRSWDLTAEIYRRSAAEEGVLLAQGTMNGGIVVFISDSRLIVAYNGHQHITRLHSTARIPVGSAVVRVGLRRRPPGGEVSLAIGDGPAEVHSIPVLPRMRSSIGMDIGLDRGSPVVDDYPAPGEFSGQLKSLTIELIPIGMEAGIGEAASEFASQMARQ